MIDVRKIKEDFPIYKKHPEIVYLDSAASSLKPIQVIDAVNHYYTKLGVNVHRGVYSLSQDATDLYEGAREEIAQFLNAEIEEVIFTRGTSNALNMVALSYGMANIHEDDEIIVSELEHHSSIMPWLNIAKLKKAKIVNVPLTKEGRITVENFKKVLTSKTKVVALTYVSNVLGYITPIEEIIKLAHEAKAIVIVDAAQAIPHFEVDVKALDCDFLAFSGHKVCGPTGIGILYGKKELLELMEPVEFGGDMVDEVDFNRMTYKELPYKFETGTPIIASAIGLAEGIKYLKKVGFENICRHEEALVQYALKELEKIKGVTVYNKTVETSVIAFNIDDVHPHDAATVFDKNHVCIRAGHHCAQFVSRFLQCISTLRASFYFYNTFEDVDRFILSVKEAVQYFSAF